MMLRMAPVVMYASGRGCFELFFGGCWKKQPISHL